ncbi:hypothetical protein [Maribacter polysaccharolyticus]|uniref:hypothetical protein n=1 Tax=Maribacter polysaccharolyticus TaxID=3020831 RepID=UPI00237FAFC3|nr:hypothetical protein [Maribacter polysaccharolyticus]MDE3742546.1 hypothetical protein [Maribacter polysaccharolyticus]
MMIHKIVKKDDPGIFLVPIAKLSHLEKWVELKRKSSSDMQLTLLFKIGQHFFGEGELNFLRPALKEYWERILGPDLEFGFFFNEDIGTIFVAGPYRGLFLQMINDKKLGSFTKGVHGILGGLGFNDRKTAEAIGKLRQGHYLIIGKTIADAVNGNH